MVMPVCEVQKTTDEFNQFMNKYTKILYQFPWT